MKYNPRVHHRRSIRLKGYDYSSPGAYFITICAHRRECLFGEVTDGVMGLNEYGQIVAARWRWLADQYPYVRLDEWVVMPNHMHGILIVVDDPMGRGGSPSVPAGSPSTSATTSSAPVDPDIPKRKPLDQLIGAFKTVSAKYINLSRHTPGLPVWQRNYYAHAYSMHHIIRNDDELNAIRRYIHTNPPKWTLDRDNLRNTRRLSPPAQMGEYLSDLDYL